MESIAKRYKQWLTLILAVFALAVPAPASASEAAARQLQRVTTAIPFPRGLEIVDGDLYVLARGRVRDQGGVSAKVNDQAGTIYRVDLSVTEPFHRGDPDEAIRNNGEVIAPPTDPPFKLWDRASDPPESDRRTDRPYCVLRYHEATDSFYICAFSGIDMPAGVPGSQPFSKNFTDALLRYDRRTESWHIVERHNKEAEHIYPHHDPETSSPPHGWLKGPDNALVLGNWLYAVAKDNSLLVRYDLSPLVEDPHAGPPSSEVIFGERIKLEELGEQKLQGQSGLAFHDGWLYVAYRTTSEIIRIRLDEEYDPVQPIVGQLVARFQPWNPETGESADLTDLTFDPSGRLYVVSAQPSRVFRFIPDPDDVFDARNGRERPWADLAALTRNPYMKSENILWHDEWLYVTSGDGYAWQEGASGTVYRLRAR